jgi:PEP-CTERM motif
LELRRALTRARGVFVGFFGQDGDMAYSQRIAAARRGPVRVARALALTALALSLSVAASSTPLYYTFSGTVTGSFTDTDILPVGSPVTYFVQIDFDRQGYEDGYGNPRNYCYDSATVDCFYAAWLGGSALPRPPTTPPPFERHLGADVLSPSEYAYISVSPTDLAFNQVYISCSGFLSTWTVGKSDIFGIDDVSDASDGGFPQQVQSNLTLTAIDTISPIPEPGTMLLLGSGLFGVALRQRRA